MSTAQQYIGKGCPHNANNFEIGYMYAWLLTRILPHGFLLYEGLILVTTEPS